MSHFTVGVLTKEEEKSLEDLLVPYQENNMENCPKEYLEFNECDKSELEEYEQHKSDYATLDEFMYEYYGYEKDEKTGKYGYWHNPNAKWDWYVVGGRWPNMLLTNEGIRVNSAKLKDIDWDSMSDQSQKKAKSLWDSNPQGIERYFAGIQKDDTRDSFIKRQAEFKTYAVITPNGEWHSKGKMGWFGCSSESDEESTNWDLSFYNKFIKDADQELVLTIVDCHI
ncbi:TPA: hypothetical protein LA742_001255 [Clostridium botulinum]|uniref:hypothetical protein n=1 Tax=Clostridium sporogenes TaxID=1509 RepID=UPI000773B71E|nr:hypothetical protein [Clostridium sporogenes]AUM93695.1 hypothetical protein RSJ11_00310 [Clostridium sporogenes]HBJ2612821.1 hypothetical protein [Clostridium botulinum]